MAADGWMNPDPADSGRKQVDLQIGRPHPARVYDAAVSVYGGVGRKA